MKYFIINLAGSQDEKDEAERLTKLRPTEFGSFMAQWRLCVCYTFVNPF